MNADNNNDEEWLDADIRALDLSYVEKSGLQVYRNYSNSFEREAIRRFRQAIEKEKADVSRLEKLLHLLSTEDIRFIPVIFCGYADELLESTLKRIVPEGVPGGRSQLFSGFGPLADLSKRLKMAYAFDVMSPDVLVEVDSIRSLRNRIAHGWQLKSQSDVTNADQWNRLHKTESLLSAREGDFPELGASVTQESSIRIRLIWLAGRLTYEDMAYQRAKALRLEPKRALYEDGATEWLVQIAAACMDSTRLVIKSCER